MSNTPPSDPNIVNTQALEGIVRAFDRVIGAKYGLGSVEPQTAATLEETKLREFEIQVVRTVMVREQAVKLEREERERLSSFWYTFPIVKTILRLLYPPRFTQPTMKQHKL